MRRNLRRALLLALCVIMVGGLFTGCGTPTTPSSTTAPKAPAATTPAGGNSGNEPVVDSVPIFPLDETLVVTVYTELSSKYAGIIDNLAQLQVYEIIKEQCNIDFQFEHASSSIAAEQYGLMFASGNYPDVIAFYRMNYYPGGLSAAYKDGIIIPLNEYMDAGYTPNYKAILDAYPPAYEELLMDGGSILEFCQFNNFEMRASEGPIIRKDLLDEYGLEVPVTIADWDNVLRTFKEKGVAIPLAFQAGVDTLFGSSIFVGSFGIGFQLYQDDGVIKYGAMQPEFKEFLELMRGWYADGLIDPDFVAATQVSVRSQMVEKLVGSAIGARGGLMSNAWTPVAEADPFDAFELLCFNYPLTADGSPAAIVPKVYYTNNGWSITKSAKSPELVALAIDWFYGHDGFLARKFGYEGEAGKTYAQNEGFYFIESDGPEDMVRTWIDNGDGTYTTISVKDTMDASPAPYSSLYFDVASNKLVQSINVPTPASTDKLAQVKAAISAMSTYANQTWTAEPSPGNLPALVLTTEESAAYSSIMATVETYVKEMVTNFILGLEPLDNFDRFVDQQKQMGIETALTYYQAAMDRYLANH